MTLIRCLPCLLLLACQPVRTVAVSYSPPVTERAGYLPAYPPYVSRVRPAYPSDWRNHDNP